ncbi:MAG: hypothetical protein M1399_02115 [Actinobacteria bacterium]|nr:hypothetical protein [Actinomycetota bacterium]MCL5445978.1 hypothetical protein [Actinomycetota bacterium]
MAVIILVLLFVPSVHSVNAQDPVVSKGNSGFVLYRPPGEGLAGTTVGGYMCTRGKRQVPWSEYAPYCVPRWTGNNSGATSSGVTGRSITVTVDIANNGGLCTFLAKSGSKSIASTAVFEHNINAYVGLFNKDFELWGRKVVVKYFNGQGCYVNELLGQDQSQAEADAQTAASLGAFADISEVSSTPPYDTALAQHHVIAIGGEFMPHSWYQQNAPYEYSYYESCSKFAQSTIDVVKSAFNGLPAIYAAGKGIHDAPARIGLVYPNAPVIRACAADLTGGLQAAHVPVAATFVYSMANFGSVMQEATAAMANFRSKRVTTVVCACDPLTPSFLADAAAAQHYYPEWLAMSVSDETMIRGIMSSPQDKAEWAHALTTMVQPTPARDQEFTVAYKLATGHELSSPPAIGDAGTVYQGILLLFSALQQAGPDLTPATFQKGMWSLPPSVQDAGMGGWSFGPGHYTTPSNFQVLYWSNDARGPITAEQGAFVACNHGAFYSYYDLVSGLPAGRQLECFGNGGSTAPWAPPSSAIPSVP